MVHVILVRRKASWDAEGNFHPIHAFVGADYQTVMDRATDRRDQLRLNVQNNQSHPADEFDVFEVECTTRVI